MKHLLPYILSFAGGFILMTLELTASRIAAPIIGTSIYSWTSIIGVILLALSAGNFSGGWLADKTFRPVKTLSYILFFASASIAAIPYLTNELSLFLINELSLIANILIISFGLFFIPSFLLGAIFPFILKLSARTISNIGKTGGILSGYSALGSIVGTFSTGFFFISRLGSSQTILILAFLLFIFGILFYLSEKSSLKNTLPLIIVATISIFMLNNKELPNEKIIFQDESAYYNIKVVGDNAYSENNNFKILFLDEGTHSIESSDSGSTELFATYNKINKEIIQSINPVRSSRGIFNPVFSVEKLTLIPAAETAGNSASNGIKTENNFEKILIIGGGAYSLPKNLKKNYPASNINVLEIDPKVKETAEKFFGLNSNEIKTIIGDARLFFKNASGQDYDIVINDAYSATISVPWHLTTVEFLRDIAKNINENGVFIANFNSSLKEDESDFLKSYYKTLKSVFPRTIALKTQIFLDSAAVQNIIFVSFKEQNGKLTEKIRQDFDAFIIDDKFLNDENSIVLSDDFAPVEAQMAPSINKYHQYYLKNIYSRFLRPSETVNYETRD